MAKITYADKTQTGAYDSAKHNAQDDNEIKNSVNALYDVGSNLADSYCAYFVQQAEGDILPIITVLKPLNLGTIVWSRVSNGMGGFETGQFRGVLEGGFPAVKTNLKINSVFPSIINGYRVDDDSVQIDVLDLTGTPFNKMFGNLVEILISN